MRRSISARLFLGFLVVLIAFGGVMGYTFYRLQRLRQELTLVNSSYLPLVMTLAQLDTLQGNLLTHIAERSLRGGTSKFLWTQVRLARVWRQRYVRSALKVARESRQISLAFQRHERFMERFKQRLRDLGQAFSDTEPLFEQLFPGAGPVESKVAQRVGERLSRLELRQARRIKSTQREVREQVAALKTQIKVDEHNAFLASLVTMVIALLVGVAVTVGSQLTLRPLKRLVASTKQIGSGDYAHRVEVRSRNELGLLAQEFNSMAAAIEEREQRLIRSERMAAAGQIASHITHEIRNPLSSISLNTELLEEEFGETDQGADEARKLCAAIRREVDRLTDITEEYLRFARLPRPQLKTEDINEILLDLLSFVSTELSGKKIELVQELAPELPAVDADENQLRQAFLNLLRNAGEAMAAAGGALHVTTRPVDGQNGRGGVEVTIADTGVGISEQHLDKLFEPFFSTKEAGTGLGLPLTQQIIQEHGGSIDVDSARGEGTVFTVRLPAARSS